MTLTSSKLMESLEIVEIRDDLRYSKALLKKLLPDVNTALFFGKVNDLNAAQMFIVLKAVFNLSVLDALTEPGHSEELQDYLVDLSVEIEEPVTFTQLSAEPVPQAELLPHLWQAAQLEVAQSIKDVANKLKKVVASMPSPAAEMHFKTMATLNARRGTIGQFKPMIQRARTLPNLVILDVSASVSRGTVTKIVDDVVALSYEANAHLAIVSRTATVWEPGTYNSEAVLNAAEFGGTHYEMLAPMMDKDWGTVVTIADYDSAWDARTAIKQRSGSIQKVLDLSLVNRPTFLSECMAQLAESVEPLLVASGHEQING